jgi:hypothetical protein
MALPRLDGERERNDHPEHGVFAAGILGPSKALDHLK